MLASARLEVSENSDILINQIDIKAETLLLELAINDSQRDAIDKKRCLFIDEIKNIERENLNHLNSVKPKSEKMKKSDMYSKFCFIIDTHDMDLPKLFGLDRIDAAFGYLVIIDSFLTSDELGLYRQLLKFANSPGNIGYENTLLNIIEKEASANMEVKYSLFNKENFIIKTTVTGLFKLDEIAISEIMVDSIKPEALFLFASIKKIRFYYYITDPSKLKYVISTIHLFEKANATKIEFISLKIITYAHISIDLCSFNELTNLKELTLNANKITFE
jgi:hypothetical protein